MSRNNSRAWVIGSMKCLKDASFNGYHNPNVLVTTTFLMDTATVINIQPRKQSFLLPSQYHCVPLIKLLEALLFLNRKEGCVFLLLSEKKTILYQNSTKLVEIRICQLGMNTEVITVLWYFFKYSLPSTCYQLWSRCIICIFYFIHFPFYQNMKLFLEKKNLMRP